MSARLLAIGLMSGTSLDGMDAALIETERSRPGKYRPRLRAFVSRAYGRALREEIARVAHGGRTDVAGLARLDREIAQIAARAVLEVCRRAKVGPREVAVVGSHGQTIFHGPVAGGAGTTVQIGAPSRIAALTGITTVGDFRTADMVAGGEGAPLMPIVHRMLFSDRHRRRAVQNLGGIGNVTWLGRGGEEILAFDTGPGVMVIDAVVRAVSRGRLAFDRGGRLAASGKVDHELVRALLRDGYFARRPPKSTGRELFGERFAQAFVARGRRRGLAGGDLVATATAFTAASIADQYARFVSTRRGLDEVWLAGGGARNPALVRAIAERLAPIPVGPIEAIGGHSDGLEAIGFAVLGLAALDGVRFDLRAITGAREPVALGVIAPAGPGRHRRVASANRGLLERRH